MNSLKGIGEALQSKFRLLFLAFIVFSTILNAQKNIPTVKIGKQVWMSKNLNTATFRNGDVILHAKTNEIWKMANEKEIPAWCYYNNDAENELKLGKLYNWFAVNDSRGLAPKGFHVPSKAEWDSLVTFLGGQPVAGKKLKNKEGWPDNGNGTNESGFSGLPGGIRYYVGSFVKERKYGHWWTKQHFRLFMLGSITSCILMTVLVFTAKISAKALDCLFVVY
jgi:uncharacterized protein (TIGR02145 family)